MIVLRFFGLLAWKTTRGLAEGLSLPFLLLALLMLSVVLFMMETWGEAK